MNRLMKQNVMTVVINFLNLLLPTLVVFLTTIIYNINSLEEFFIVQQAFNTISFYLSMLPAAVQGTVIGISSLKRMNAFFENDEYTQSSLSGPDQYQQISSGQASQRGGGEKHGPPVIEIKNVSYSWKDKI